MLICGVDLETTGLDVEHCHLTEVGAVLWDTDLKRPVAVYNNLISIVDPAIEIPPIVVQKTGITREMLLVNGVGRHGAILRLHWMMQQAAAVVAHNGTRFDFPILRRFLREEKLDFPPEAVLVDACTDVPYPEEITTRTLVHLAAEHGFCNPFAHRAVFDVMTMLTVLSRYSIEEVLRLAAEPTVTLVALTPYELRDKPKARGYRWEADTKRWVKSIKQSQVEKEIRDCDFLVQVAEETLHA